MENLKRVVEHATEDGIKVEAVILKQEEKMDIIVRISKEKKQKILEWL